MSWVWWLLAPLAVTLLVAVVTWLAGRPRRPPTSEEAVRSHRRFLADLADLVDASAPARRLTSAGPPAGPPVDPFAGPGASVPGSAATASERPRGTV